MAHRNVRLTPITRLELVGEVAAGSSQAEVARQFRVSCDTVAKWWRRFRKEGAAGLEDRPFVRHKHPRRGAPHRLGAGGRPLHRLRHAPPRRPPRPRPHAPCHAPHRALRAARPWRPAAPGREEAGAIPQGGGKRFAPGFAETRSGPHSKQPLGLDYLHVAVDDHSRYPDVEALPDERAPVCAAFLERAVSHFRERGVRVRRVLTDNAWAYGSHAFHRVASAHGVTLKLTRPHRPQSNGKAERFIKTLQHERAYARRYRSNEERLRQLPRRLYRYNARRPHGGIGGIGGATLASRL